MTTARMRRINELLREVIAEEITHLKDPGIGFVTVTGVDTSPDLRNAIVYYTVLGDEDDRKATAAALRRATAKIQASIGPQVRMKYLPRLSFRIDPAIETGLRIEEKLRELHRD